MGVNAQRLEHFSAYVVRVLLKAHLLLLLPIRDIGLLRNVGPNVTDLLLDDFAIDMLGQRDNETFFACLDLGDLQAKRRIFEYHFHRAIIVAHYDFAAVSADDELACVVPGVARIDLRQWLRNASSGLQGIVFLIEVEGAISGLFDLNVAEAVGASDARDQIS